MNNQRVAMVLGMMLSAIAFLPGKAYAYKVNGLGLGGDATLGSASGLAGNYGLGDFELELIVGMQFDLPTDRAFEADFSLLAGGFGTLASNDTTNFQLGGRIGVRVDGYSGLNEFGDGWVAASLVGIPMELDLRVEHRLDANLELIFQVGASFTIWPNGRATEPASGASLDYGDVPMMAGVGFRYFFDGFDVAESGSSSSSSSSPSEYGGYQPAQESTYTPQESPPPASDSSGGPAWE